MELFYIILLNTASTFLLLGVTQLRNESVLLSGMNPPKCNSYDFSN